MAAPAEVFVPSADETVAVWAEQFNEVTVIAEQPTTPCWTGCEGATPAELDLFGGAA